MNKHRQGPTSRPLAVADSLLHRRVDPELVYAKRVALVGETQVLSTNNGRWCFVDAFRLLSRLVGDLTVVVPSTEEDLFREIAEISTNAWAIRSLTIVREIDATALQSCDAILNIGTVAQPDFPMTSINSNGWVARICSGSAILPANCTQANPLGALMAASFGVAEVFKRIFPVPADVAPIVRYCEFSLFDLSATPTNVGPVLPESIHLPLSVLIGVGAIGNGIALLLSQLPVHGHLHLVDKQSFAEENLSTCILMEKDGWLDRPKAERVAEWLMRRRTLHVSAEHAAIEAAQFHKIKRRDIDVVMNVLDYVDARRESQSLWPSIMIDGAINEVGAGVFQHRVGSPNLGCLRCWFVAPLGDERELQSKWTGLHVSSLAQIDRALTEGDIAAAAEDSMDWLRECQRQGKTVCSVITEAQLKVRLGVGATAGFRPSVPFVATAAAALTVSETLKALLFPTAKHGSLFQLGNIFLGPEASVLVHQPPLPRCVCTLHRSTIERLQRDRRTRRVESAESSR